MRHLVRQQPAFGQRDVGARRGFARHAIARLRNRGGQFCQPPPSYRHGGNHRHAQRGFERGRIERQPIALGKVHHVERNHGRAAKLQHFLRENQMLFEVRGIEHDHQHVRLGLPHLFAHDDLARHLFVRAGGVEAIAARQVDQFHRFAAGQDQAPRLSLDGDARIVGDLLARARQRVEQRALARVGIADQRGDTGVAAHAVAPISSTCIARACTRRSATVIRPISTASGSRDTNTPR